MDPENTEIMVENEEVTSPTLLEVKKINPLVIHLIFNEVMSYLPVNTLTDCRLVNRVWSANVVSFLRKKVKFVNVAAEDFPKLCDDFEKTELLPFAKLKIHVGGLSLEYFNSSKFFTRHGSDIEELEFMELTESSGLVPDDDDDDEQEKTLARENLNALRHILKNTMNLNYLSLELDHISRLLRSNFIFDEQDLMAINLTHVERLKLSLCAPLRKQFVDGLFTMLPNIRNIELGYFDEDQFHDWEAFVAAFHADVRVIKCSSHLLPADFWEELMAKETPKLRVLETGYDLYENELSDYSHEDRLEMIHSQIEHLKCTSEFLMHLTLIVANTSAMENFQLPLMKNLESLTLKATSPALRGFSVAPIQPDHVPKLQFIHIAPELIFGKFFGVFIFRNVRKINLGGVKNFIDVFPNTSFLEKIGYCFPNLKSLINFEVPMNVTTMETIVSQFTNIEHLEFTIVDDDSGWMENFNLVISGIPVDSEWEWYASQVTDRLQFESLSSLIDPPGPSFREIKCLKTLILSFDAHGVQDSYARIDEVAVYWTFLRLSPKLRLTLRGDFSIPDELASKLTAHYQHIVIKPNEQAHRACTDGFKSDDYVNILRIKILIDL